jgi:hypothetical protein
MDSRWKHSNAGESAENMEWTGQVRPEEELSGHGNQPWIADPEVHWMNFDENRNKE